MWVSSFLLEHILADQKQNSHIFMYRFFFFFKILFIYLTEREHKQGKQQTEGEREAGSPLSREPDGDSVPGHWDHDLSWRQTLNQLSYPGVPVFSYSLGKYPVVQLLDHKVVLLLTFWGTSILFSTVAAPVCIPTSCAQGFLLLHILANTCCFLCPWF